MQEKYNLAVEKGRLAFTLWVGDIPEALLKASIPPSGYAMLCRMGDARLLECVVWRQQGKPGGVFVVQSQEETLYAAVAETALAFSMGLAYFGDMVAKARYGADIFEHPDGAND